MVLGYHGKHVSLEQVREVTGSGRDGTTARLLVDAATWFGLDARGVRADIDDLDALPAGSLLFWELNHFVVLDRVTRGGVRILDPTRGRKMVDRAELDRSYTGIAILIEPGPAFERGDERSGNSVARYCRPVLRERAALGSVIGTSALLRLAGLVVPLMTALVVDRVVPWRDRGLLGVLVASFIMVTVFNFFSTWVRGRLLVHMQTRLDFITTMNFVEHLAVLPYAFHLRRSAGDMLTRLRSNASVRGIFTSTTISGVLDGSFAILYLALLFALSRPVAVLAVSFAIGQVLTLVAARRAVQRRTTDCLRTEAKSHGFSMQFFAGIGTLKASGTETRAVTRFANVYRDELAASAARSNLLALLEAGTGLVRSAAPLVLLTVAALQVVDGQLSLGAALAVNAIAAGFLAPIDSLVNSCESLMYLRSYTERLDDVFDAKPEQDPAAVRPAPVLRGHVHAESVSFRYDPLSADVVKDVTLDVPEGAFVAIVGRSGSGKTTLAHTLLGLYQPSAGRLWLDGVDIRELDLRTVRSQLGVVTQDPYLFSDSIRENIAFADPSLPLDAVIEAARLAAVHDDIEAMPLGYDTLVGEGGAMLSGGQRQRIAIARAIASRPRVMLLDEATSHLDAISEQAVYESLEALRCTRIVVAHRLSTVLGADLIVVMQEGEVVATGTHSELMATSDAYRELVWRQMPTESAADSADEAATAVGAAALPAAPVPVENPLESTAASLVRLLAVRTSDALARFGNRSRT